MVRKVGDVGYELNLLAIAKIHPMFLASQLKPELGRSNIAVLTLPPVDMNGIIQPKPVVTQITGMSKGIFGKLVGGLIWTLGH